MVRYGSEAYRLQNPLDTLTSFVILLAGAGLGALAVLSFARDRETPPARPQPPAPGAPSTPPAQPPAPSTCPVNLRNNTIIRAVGAPEIYIFGAGDCRKWHIPDERTLSVIMARLAAQGYPQSWPFTELPAATLAAIPLGGELPRESPPSLSAPAPAPSTPPPAAPVTNPAAEHEGCIVIDGGTYYLIEGGRKRWIRSLATAEQLGAHVTRCTHYVGDTSTWPQGPDLP